MSEPDFVRNNQRSYLRVPCEDYMMKSYEYQMYQHNTINSFLSFQNRCLNGQQYLYFEVSGMQSLDIFLQTRKFKRTFGVNLIKALVKLCNESAEFALRIESVNFNPRYIMVTLGGEEIHFIYGFQNSTSKYTDLEKLLECCVENLDYSDELLSEKIYQVYEQFLAQGNNFFLLGEMERLLEILQDKEENKTETEEVFVETVENQEITTYSQSKVSKKEYKKLRQGIILLILMDILFLFFWNPLNLLKIFFFFATEATLVCLLLYLRKKDKEQQKEVVESLRDSEYVKEYELLAKKIPDNDNVTQIIAVEETEGILHNIQNAEPKYICINEKGSIIGKDEEKAQIHIGQECISRIHAFVIREGTTCFVEDLNSTNGTRINGSSLEPRIRYPIKSGDKVCFANIEYIFR